ncbi:MAG: FAD-dependent thymidylate synthase [Planctomycetes bacterium]|nr:FAD-dependent thymidylate synthase [Planctomycetota bacterium]
MEGTQEPIVRLTRHFTTPFDVTVASARTCYAPRVIEPQEVSIDERARSRRDRIAQSIYQAGHHTTFQHATFTFALERVSRQFIWSFLHSHPFYNSEQVSQRYVEVRPGNFVEPPLSEAGRELFRRTVAGQMAAYADLTESLEGVVRREYTALFPHRDADAKRWASVRERKQMEVARYVLPVATQAHLYHTISGITLHRYHRLSQQFDTPWEQRRVVEGMVLCVNEVDPDFLRLAEDPIPLDETPEFRYFAALEEVPGRPGGGAYVLEFDESLRGRVSLLVDSKPNAEETMAQAVRDVLGVTRDAMANARAIDLVLNPAQNRYLADTLNLTAHAKLTRSMVHPHFTFRKKLSHTADSQDQRHRLTPGSRPILARHVQPDQPDYIVPPLIASEAVCRDRYVRSMEEAWAGIRGLLDLGEPLEYAMYLLPNAFPIRFEESGDLLAFHHKWTKRLCCTAQEEIWAACRDEVAQVASAHPAIGRFLGAPCALRLLAKETPYCPEGDRFCGVPVWKLPVERYERVL